MSKKKTTRNVIDYDPLAWLKEEADVQDTEIDEQAEPDEKGSASQAAVDSETAPVRQPVDDAVNGQANGDDNEAFGFFSDEETASDDQSGPEQNMAEDAGFGFFSDQNNEVDNHQQDDNCIDLGAELTIRTVASCKQLIDDCRANHSEIVLDAGSLQKIDTAGLQMLYSLSKTLQKESQQIRWKQTSSMIDEAAESIGLPLMTEGETEDSNAFGFF